MTVDNYDDHCRARWDCACCWWTSIQAVITPQRMLNFSPCSSKQGRCPRLIFWRETSRLQAVFSISCKNASITNPGNASLWVCVISVPALFNLILAHLKTCRIDYLFNAPMSPSDGFRQQRCVSFTSTWALRNVCTFSARAEPKCVKSIDLSEW